ncbi:hypothetical protein POSPLADRAFT_1063575 [Postia placenta MAD-698-R-SB12]|uniref:Uncharacterized protein n=1 Tax=Postia placenta MAD-698-R-SB12 TaxID=670580 RepID=A0A1X6MHE2_9APHY|nr:hypothetical protein POSPLADRAFT_1063575 [Postia placenta MAD-698-R-SB12]OSX55765.1 hypothetical protein POSPLADRAFT_1063575 [Postia placenta MAD-698-R-SB12]
MESSSSPLRLASPSRPPSCSTLLSPSRSTLLSPSCSTLLYPSCSTLLSPSRPRRIPFSRARAQGALSACQALLPDLRAGAFLRQLHAVQNDWFALSAQARAALFSWQEAITVSPKGLLDAAAIRETAGSGGGLAGSRRDEGQGLYLGAHVRERTTRVAQEPLEEILRLLLEERLICADAVHGEHLLHEPALAAGFVSVVGNGDLAI